MCGWVCMWCPAFLVSVHWEKIQEYNITAVYIYKVQCKWRLQQRPFLCKLSILPSKWRPHKRPHLHKLPTILSKKTSPNDHFCENSPCFELHKDLIKNCSSIWSNILLFFFGGEGGGGSKDYATLTIAGGGGGGKGYATLTIMGEVRVTLHWQSWGE